MIRQLPSGTMVGINLLSRKLKDFMYSLMRNAGDLKTEDRRLAILSLSQVDRIREEAELMADISKELDGNR